MRFSGHDRGARGLGVRDLILVLPSVGCTNRCVELVGLAREDVRIVTHQHGCGMLGDDAVLTSHVLGGMSANRNVCGAVVVGLGCETNQPARVVEHTRSLGGDTRVVVFQHHGGMDAALAAVSRTVDDLLDRPTEGVEGGPADLLIGLAHEPGSGAEPLLETVAQRLGDAGTRILRGATTPGIEARVASNVHEA